MPCSQSTSLPELLVHGGLIGHCAVETVVFGHEVLAHDSQHTRFVEHGVLIVSSQRIVRLQLRFRRRDARVGHRHRAAGNVLFLEEHDRLAGLQKTDGGDESRGARTGQCDIDLEVLRGAPGRRSCPQTEGGNAARRRS